MAKKSFKNNPAMQFISTPAEDEEPIQEQHSAPKVSEIPEGYKMNPMFVEVKSRRLQLVMQPSLYERVKAAAKAQGLSVNEYIHQTLDAATKEN